MVRWPAPSTVVSMGKMPDCTRLRESDDTMPSCPPGSAGPPGSASIAEQFRLSRARRFGHGERMTERCVAALRLRAWDIYTQPNIMQVGPALLEERLVRVVRSARRRPTVSARGGAGGLGGGGPGGARAAEEGGW